MPRDEQEQNDLSQIKLDINEIKGSIAKIQGYCEPCRSQVSRHGQILDGMPADITHPGLSSRVHDLEKIQSGLKELRNTAAEERAAAVKDRERSAQWFRRQLGILILALLSMLGVQGYSVFREAPEPPPITQEK
jgi:hypothetical protein